MFGYVKERDVFEALKMEARITERHANIYSRLAAEADNDVDRNSYWSLSEEFRIRHDEVTTIIRKLLRTI